MEFDDRSVDLSGVEDRRGSGGGMSMGLPGGMAVGGGGLGVVGLIIWLVVGALNGGGSGTAGVLPGTNIDQGAGSTVNLQELCSEPDAINKHTECRLAKVYNVADVVWREELARQGGGQQYRRPGLVYFTRGTQTPCGYASSNVGPFYCPGDEKIYFDLKFLEQLQQQFGAPGQSAQAYIVAHEFGHHIQNITGIERRVRSEQRGLTAAETNKYSVAMELQADCYAGVWMTLADKRGENGISVAQSDIAEVLTAASAVGDDNIQQQTSGRVNQEAFTHGSSADRKKWTERGMQTGDPTKCTTFSETGLAL